MPAAARRASLSSRAAMPSAPGLTRRGFRNWPTSVAAADLEARAHRGLAPLVPVVTDRERRHHGCGYRRFVSPVESGTNLVLEPRRAGPPARASAGPQPLDRSPRPEAAPIVGRGLPKHADAGLKTQILDHDRGQPVIRGESKSQSSSIKQYVRDHGILRAETTSHHTPDFGVHQSVEHVPEVRPTMATAHERHLDAQPDVLETFVDRDQLNERRQPTVSPSGRRTPGWKRNDPRLLAVLPARVGFAFWANRGRGRTTDPHPAVADTVGKTTTSDTLGPLRHDLAKGRAQGLVAHRRHADVPTAVGRRPDRGAVPEAVPADRRPPDGWDRGPCPLGRTPSA